MDSEYFRNICWTWWLVFSYIYTYMNNFVASDGELLTLHHHFSWKISSNIPAGGQFQFYLIENSLWAHCFVLVLLAQLLYLLVYDNFTNAAIKDSLYLIACPTASAIPVKSRDSRYFTTIDSPSISSKPTSSSWETFTTLLHSLLKFMIAFFACVYMIYKCACMNICLENYGVL